jgi:hypothetical protein
MFNPYVSYQNCPSEQGDIHVTRAIKPIDGPFRYPPEL